MNQPHQHGPQCNHGHAPNNQSHSQSNSHGHGHGGHQGFQGPTQMNPK